MSEIYAPPAIYEVTDTSPVPENITDKKISLMTDTERQLAADKLYNQSL